MTMMHFYLYFLSSGMKKEMGCVVANDTVHTWWQKYNVVVVKCERALIVKNSNNLSNYQLSMVVINAVVIFYYLRCDLLNDVSVFCLDIFNISQTLPNKFGFCRKLRQYIVSKCLKFRLSFNLEVFIINTQQHGSYFYQQLQGRSPNLWPDTF